MDIDAMDVSVTDVNVMDVNVMDNIPWKQAMDIIQWPVRDGHQCNVRHYTFYGHNINAIDIIAIDFNANEIRNKYTCGCFQIVFLIYWFFCFFL